MMDDQDLEARLKTYRPAGPTPELRARVIGDQGTRGVPPGARSAWAWLPAVAAMLLAATFYWLAAAGRARVFAELPPPGAAQVIDLNLETQP